MKTCYNCGNELIDSAEFCMNCGVFVGETKDDIKDIIWALVGFFNPIAGIVLFFYWRKDKPKSARACILGALLAIILIIAYYVLYFAYIMASINSSFSIG